MKKKFLFGTMATALLMVTACTSEVDVVSPSGEEALVDVSVDIPQLQMNSRAFSDGAKATTLQYAVYEVSGEETSKTLKMLNEVVTDNQFNMSKTIQLKLRKGQKYGLVFWADAGDNKSPYTVDFSETGATMSADYNSYGPTNLPFPTSYDTLDAFYCYTDFTVTGDMAIDAKLYRPFAQINIGTNDLEALQSLGNITRITSNLTAYDVYKSMDLVTGKVTGEAGVVGFMGNDIPNSTQEKFPVPNYDYVAMGYFLVGAEKSLIKVEFNLTAEGIDNGLPIDRRQVNNVPVQRNWKTNIYGQLFTDNANLNVEIVPGFDGTTEPGYEYTDLDLLADKGGELTLTGDIDIDHDITINNNGVLNLNGYEVKSSHGKKLVIRGEVMTKASEAIAVLTIKGNGTVALPIIVGEDGKLKIEGGTYTESITAPETAAGEEAAIEITGGTFTNFDPSDFVPDGSQVVEDGGSKLVIPEGITPVDANNFKTAIAQGGELLLIQDYYYTAGKDINLLKDMTLDLNGHELSTVGGTYGDAVVIGNGANVTIKNGTIKEADGATQDKMSAVVLIKTSYACNATLETVEIEGMRPIYLNNANPETTVTIKSGKYISTGGNGEAVYVQKGGKVIIEGGYFANPNNAQTPNSFLLNILDSTRAGKDPREFLEVKGGTFVNFDPSNNNAEGAGTNFVANGYKVVSSTEGADTIYVVIPN